MYKLQVLEDGKYVTYRESDDLKLLLYVADCLFDLDFEVRVMDESDL